MGDRDHDCPVGGCQHRIPHFLLMCKAHWALVPAEIQRSVYRAWSRGAGAGTQAHADAMVTAVLAVEQKLAA
jgi:hypothetical protein